MTCCIVGLLIMAAIGRIRRALGLRRTEAEVLFAPIARWPAPGQTFEPAAAATVAQPQATAIFRYCALGVGLSAAITPLMVVTGVAENTATAGAWLVRTLAYVVLIAVALTLSRTVGVGRRLTGAGWLLIAVGAVVFELGILDMHVFRLFEMDHADLAAIVFHNLGPALMLAGVLILLYGLAGRTMTSRRSSRSTVSSAQPESSAVTLSSTPPVTR